MSSIDIAKLHSLFRDCSAPIANGAERTFLFAIYDVRAQRYAPPTPAYNPYIIIRSIAQVIRQNSNAPLALYPDDFILYCVGSYNEVTGLVGRLDHVSLLDTSPPQVGPSALRLGSIRDLIMFIEPSEVLDFMRSALAHSEPVSSPDINPQPSFSDVS